MPRGDLCYKAEAEWVRGGFSMSALLWTSCSSIWAGVGVFPSPARATKNRIKPKSLSEIDIVKLGQI